MFKLENIDQVRKDFRTSDESDPKTTIPKYLHSDLDLYNPLKTTPTTTLKHSPTNMRKSEKFLTSPFKSGHLYRKEQGKIKTFWKRVYFELKNDQLNHYSDETDQEIGIDLRVCMVKEIKDSPMERKNIFEIVSPSESYTLQAENEHEMSEWIVLLQTSIMRSLNNDIPSPPNSSQSSIELRRSSVQSDHGVPTIDVLEQLTELPGNNKCAECSCTKQVEWASCNYGILLCITCSGIHRGLGREVSKVRSLELDIWEQSTLDFMRALGNTCSNDILELGFVEDNIEGFVRPTADSEQ